MRTRIHQILSVSTLAAIALIASAAFTSLASAEPPNRVGRVSLVEGNVSFFADRNEGWKPARINFPVTSENSVWTEGGARAEVRIGASALRLNDNSILDFIRIDDEQAEAYLQRGTINIRTRHDGHDNRDRNRDYQHNMLTIQTREGRFVIESNGRYAINASDNGVESRISVYSGRARFESGRDSENSVTVDRGRTLTVFGDRDANRDASNRGNTNFRFDTASESNFDRWADARDRSWDQTHTRYASSQVVSSYMTGYEDLDTYGDWIDNGEYGRIWAPRNVSSNWAPYRHGSWSYVNPWGWTWVDDAPWGFAPFHYGRWVTIGSRWCWWPGQYNRRPAYAPALVAWYGRPGLSVSVSVGEPVGWFPLAPREHYVPRYTNNVTYIRNVNYVTNNVTIINNNPPQRYQNQLPGATFVNQNVFVQSKPIAVNAIRETPANIALYKPLQVMDVPRPVLQGQPMQSGQSGQSGQAQQQGAQQGNNANSVWARGRNNVAPVYAPAPQMQGPQVPGQPQIQGAQIPIQNQQAQQNQVPNRGAAVAGAAVGAVGAAAVINNAPQIRSDGLNRAPPTPSLPPQGLPAQQIPPRMVGAQNAIPSVPVPVAAPAPAPAPIFVQSAQRPPVVNQAVQPVPVLQQQQQQQQQQQPQPAYVQQGAKPGQINGGEQMGQPRLRSNRPETGDVIVNPQARPQREGAQQNAVPVQRQERQERQEQRQQERQAQAAPRVQPQQQAQQIQPQQVQQQPRPQAQLQQQPQQQAEKPQHANKQPHAEKPQNAPRVEGQGKPGQQQQ